MNYELLGAKEHRRAIDRYYKRYNNHLYNVAIKDKGIKYCNKLLNDTLAICGSPYYKLSLTNYDQKALEFLNLFI